MTTLTPVEVTEAQAIIDRTPPGTYELKVIYGAAWSSVTSPTTFGRKFKNTVMAGGLKKIQYESLRTDNHNMYTILGGA